MKVAEAIAIANRSASADAASQTVFLPCGFTPLHLQTYLKAHLKLRFPDSNIAIETGLFGDLAGNLERVPAGSNVAAVIEWSDIDARLGWRHAGGWGPRTAEQIPEDSARMFERILGALARGAGRNWVAVCPPTLPISIPGHAIPALADPLRLDLEAQLAEFLKRAAALDGVRVVSRAEIDANSPAPERHDLRLDLTAGFPYQNAHANVIAGALVEVLFPAPPKKGLITDLDDTLWRGIVGEIGPDAVSWDLERHTHVHALYQQALAAMADYGVLVACASKNDPAVVRKAFERPDILLAEAKVFPIEVHWGAKSESVGRILKAWNIGADSVVFVDDSPIELAEVQAKFPEIECILFRAADMEGVAKVLARLRKLFGKQAVLEEDRIRAASLRAAVQVPAGSAAASTDFLERAEGSITFEAGRNPRDARALELVNKTNQFNLNGRRLTEAEWLGRMELPESFALTVSYQDRFGPLGKIAVVAGTVRDGVAHTDVWVMSCRAFSRRIEHHTLEYIFSKLGAREVVFDYARTDRNGPLQKFLASMGDISKTPVRIAHAEFQSKCPALPHSVKV